MTRVVELPGSSRGNPRGASGDAAPGAPVAGPGSLAALVARWRAEAEILRRRGAGAQADVLAACADELAAALQQHALEALTPAQAAQETGFSASAIRRRFPGRKTIPRSALPVKGGRAAADGPDLAGELLRSRRP